MPPLWGKEPEILRRAMKGYQHCEGNTAVRSVLAKRGACKAPPLVKGSESEGEEVEKVVINSFI